LGHVPVSSTARSILFLLFLFGIGYSVGPQVFRTLRGDGYKWVILGVFVTTVGLLTAYLVARYLGLDPGFSAGLLSGSLTESPAIGTASEAEAQLGLARVTPGTFSGWRAFDFRAYRLAPDGRAIGRTVAEAEAMIPDARVFVQRIRRNGAVLEAEPTTALAKGDVIAVSGRREVLVNVIGKAAEEVEDRELLDVPAAAFDVVLTNKVLAGRTIEDIARSETAFRGVGLRSIRRGDQEIPVAPGTALERGDVLRLVGPEPAVERASQAAGTVIRPSDVTDFVTLGLAIFLGGVLGVVVALPIGNVRISLSTSVGTLLAGILVGWLRSVRPLFGRIPDGAVAFMTSLGLAAFVAMVGLHAGPVFVEACARPASAWCSAAPS
jgi:putative transport protein